MYGGIVDGQQRHHISSLVIGIELRAKIEIWDTHKHPTANLNGTKYTWKQMYNVIKCTTQYVSMITLQKLQII